MNSSRNDLDNNVLWHNSKSNSSSNNHYSHSSSNNHYDHTSLNNNHYGYPIINNNQNQASLHKLNKKMIISIIVSICVLVSIIFTFCVNAKKNNKTENSTENSIEMVNNNSNTDDTWIVDDQLSGETISNGDMGSIENNDEIVNMGDEIQENTTEGTTITGSASTTETEQPVETTMEPIVTTYPTEVITSGTTIAPTVAPVVTPQPVITQRPIVTPQPVVTPRPTATPRPVVVQYASLVTPYTNKDSNGQIFYILANSNSRYYSASELQKLTKEQLRFARNEIFARRGGKFTSSDLQQYFNSRSWYTPIRNAADFEDKDLNSYEIENVKLIQSVEKSK